MSNSESVNELLFPPLPIDEWEPTKNALHLFFQIVGKVRLELFPKKNHWWHVTLYISSRGLTTRPIPFEDRIFEIEFDLIEHKLLVKDSHGGIKGFSLINLSVSDFYKKLFSILNELNIDVSIKSEPYDVPFSNIPFESDNMHIYTDKEKAKTFWIILTQVNSVFEDFAGKFVGKSTPVHLYWHHMDLAVTRFSGKVTPYEGGTKADKEAYSHEVISFGFWAGDDNVRAPAFYSYTYPEPKGLAKEILSPEEAFWNTDSVSAMAIMMYDDVRNNESPQESIMDFLDSAYNAGAKLANWDFDDFLLKTR